jgi:hypothetical protein
MFFQGYYFSVTVGFEELLKKRNHENTQPMAQILKSFGIINLQVNPNPHVLTLNGLPYANGDNKFVDYGSYELRVEEPGYIPLTIDIDLSRNQSFYLNTVKLFKIPVEKPFDRPTSRIEKSGKGFIGWGSSGSIVRYPTGTGTGTPLNSILLPSGTGASSNAASIVKSGIVSLGEGYFAYKSKIYILNAEGILMADESFRSIELCPNAKMIYGEIYCPDSKKFMTGKYKDLRDSILEVNSQFIRTDSSLIRLGGTIFNSSTPLTGNIAFSGSSKLISHEGKQVILNQEKLYDIENNFKEIRIEGFDGILRTEKFGDETVTVGKRQSSVWVRIEDAKGNKTEAQLLEFAGNDVTIASIGGAYVIASEKEVVLYYKGARSTFRLATGNILFVS